MFIDTHTHLYLPQFSDSDVEEEINAMDPDDKIVGVSVVDRALKGGVGYMIFPNVDAGTVTPMKRLHNARPQSTAMAIGLHPTEVDDRTVNKQLEFVEKELKTKEYLAIGEVGIDLYWDRTHRERQMEIFEAQLLLANSANLPVIIHSRDGLDEVLEVIQGAKPAAGLVFHSFGGTPKDVEKIRKQCDCYFGINGIVTFKNSNLAATLPAIGLERILLETDAPYLSPVPHRGKRNESAFLPHIAQKIAEVLGVQISEIERQTELNARTLFKI